ncbi:SprA-related family protein [Marinomonas gallaica]|uniref:SprA-related family protein n=1 Tax=Marinomonas gallaica TaxID=1806667 RepID=A0A1C3JUZ0_9GAMM|nr:putative metalloprotease CJM1_0395 family protein [Marinomonas gallaica]SBT19003.1 SprA-related family protein [Marinomonas gallaica]SBT21958.1 SprA-related family protein [Marinomonas gallaica]
MSGSIQHSIEAQRFIPDRSNSSGNVYASNSPSEHSSESASLIRANSDYTVNVSEDAQALFAQDQEEQSPSPTADETQSKDDSDNSDKSSDEKSEQTLTEEEQQKVDSLKARDEEVRIHEQAHASTGGQYAGSPSYSYEQGPDGKRYVTDGEVSIDVSPIANDPQATIEKMRQVYRAALAPAEPSSADRSVANEAQQQMSEATADLSKEARGDDVDASNNNASAFNRSTLASAYNATKEVNTSGSNIDLVA